MTTRPDLVAKVRALREKHGYSLQEAMHRVWRDDFHEMVTRATSLDEIKSILHTLIERI